MKVVRYDQLYDTLRLRLPAGVPDGIMLRALRDSGQRFCSESGAWKENLTPITTVADQISYAVINPWTADIVGINRIGLRTADEIAADADAEGSEISPLYYAFIPATQKVKFTSAPASTVITSGLFINASLIPQFNADEISEWFLNMYMGGILGGACATICSMPQYFNERIAKSGGKDFNNEMSRAIRDATTCFTGKPYRNVGGYNLI